MDQHCCGSDKKTFQKPETCTFEDNLHQLAIVPYIASQSTIMVVDMCHLYREVIALLERYEVCILHEHMLN